MELSLENFEIPGFSQLNDLRIDSTTTRNRNKRGILLYAKSEIASSIQLCRTIQKYSLRKTLEAILFKYDNIYVLVLYRNSNFPIGDLEAELRDIICNDFENREIIIVGDFNLCLKTTTNRIANLLRENNFSSLLDLEYSTTAIGSQIDWAFSNMDSALISAITYETIHSYHDGICISVAYTNVSS